jgi:hypothetical protein
MISARVLKRGCRVVHSPLDRLRKPHGDRAGSPSAGCRCRRLQADRLGDPQAGGVAGRQEGVMFDVFHTAKKEAADFLQAKDDRQLLWLAGLAAATGCLAAAGGPAVDSS